MILNNKFTLRCGSLVLRAALIDSGFRKSGYYYTLKTVSSQACDSCVYLNHILTIILGVLVIL